MEKRNNTHHARRLRREMTDAEKLLWRVLRAREFDGCKFRRQHAIGLYIVDFVCIAEKLVVEADGGQHLQQVKKDEQRTRFLELQGFRVLRFWNHEILTMSEAVLERIWMAIRDNHTHPSPLSLAPPSVAAAGEGENRDAAAILG